MPSIQHTTQGSRGQEELIQVSRVSNRFEQWVLNETFDGTERNLEQGIQVSEKTKEEGNRRVKGERGGGALGESIQTL